MLPALLNYEARKLREDARAEVQLGIVPSGYQRQPVKGFVQLDPEGNFLRFRPTAGANPKKDRGRIYITPHVMRSSGIRPKLLADNAEYALGVSKSPGDNDAKVAQRHAAFIEAVRECFEVTRNQKVGAVLRYLTTKSSPPPLLDEFDANLTYSFMVGEVRPFEDPDVQAFWAAKVIGAGDNLSDTGTGESLISGELGQLMTAEPVKVKGIPGGQMAGMNLVSANAPAFLSYGLSSSELAPILATEAETYANGLNRLLREDATHYAIGPAVFVFWTQDGGIPPVVEALRDGPAVDLFGEYDDKGGPNPIRPEQLRTKLKSIWTAEGHGVALGSNFYAAGLSASGSRIVVRSFLQLSVQELMERLAYFFSSQIIAQWDGSPPKPLGIYALAASIVRDFKKEATAQAVEGLVSFALSGSRLPHSFLLRLATRSRAERRVTFPRAALTKMTLTSLGVIQMGDLEQVDTSYPDVGYQLGRLLAVLNDIQGLALGPGLNATLADRFYGSMSTAPLSVFGRVMQGVQPHLARLRKERPGAYYRQIRALEEVVGQIGPNSVPRVLSLEQQALFGIGYYHQRAEIGRAITAHKLAMSNEVSESAELEEDNG